VGYLAGHPLSPSALAILSLLREGPMHPYEVARRMGGDGVDGRRLRSLYHAVDQLRRASLIAPLETSRDGRRPERTVYGLTERGEHELVRWLRSLLATPVREPARFVTALAHLHQLTPEDACRQLEERVRSLVSAIVDASKPIPLLETDYERMLTRAELHWLHSLIDDLRSGRVTWSAGGGPEVGPPAMGGSRPGWPSPAVRSAGGGELG